jgi:hypothetical protein
LRVKNLAQATADLYEPLFSDMICGASIAWVLDELAPFRRPGYINDIFRYIISITQGAAVPNLHLSALTDATSIRSVGTAQ